MGIENHINETKTVLGRSLRSHRVTVFTKNISITIDRSIVKSLQQ